MALLCLEVPRSHQPVWRDLFAALEEMQRQADEWQAGPRLQASAGQGIRELWFEQEGEMQRPQKDPKTALLPHHRCSTRLGVSGELFRVLVGRLE